MYQAQFFGAVFKSDNVHPEFFEENLARSLFGRRDTKMVVNQGAPFPAKGVEHHIANISIGTNTTGDGFHERCR